MVEFDPASILLIGLSLTVAVLLARSIYKFGREIKKMQKKVQDKIFELEFQAQSLKSDFRELDESSKGKVSTDYLNKRIDALINLLNNKT